jgi:hypothetical protein
MMGFGESATTTFRGRVKLTMLLCGRILVSTVLIEPMSAFAVLMDTPVGMMGEGLVTGPLPADA